MTSIWLPPTESPLPGVLGGTRQQAMPAGIQETAMEIWSLSAVDRQRLPLRPVSTPEALREILSASSRLKVPFLESSQALVLTVRVPAFAAEASAAAVSTA